MKNTIIITVSFVSLAFLLALTAKSGLTSQNQVSSISSTNAKSNLRTEEILYDFGTISMKNGNVTKEFTVVNPTENDIFVEKVFTSCMCTKAFLVLPDGDIKGPFGMPGMSYVPPANEVIKAGENRVIRVVYDPNAHGPAGVGRIDRFISVVEKNGGTVQFEIKANVTP